MSRLILGCGNFGGVGSAPAFWGRGDTEPQARALMDHAFDVGINVFDTADAYGGGRSESFIGRWLRPKGSSVREQMLISSKVFHPVSSDRADRGLSRARILRQIDTSLERLQTDRLDMYLIHEPDPDTPLEETIAALDTLVRAGKVRFFGASNIETWRLQDALAISETQALNRFEWIQNSYSLLDRAVESDLLPLCVRERIGFTAFSPLAGGWLTGKYRAAAPFPEGSRMTLRPEPYEQFVSDQTFNRIDRLSEAARSRGVTLSSLALAWVLAHPRVDAAVIGPRTPAHIDDALAALAVPLSADDRTTLFSTEQR